MQRQEYTAAENTLRETLQYYEKNGIGTWRRFNCESLVGTSLAGQQKFAEAEPLLLNGYDGMVQRRSAMGAPNQYWIDRAQSAVTELYQRLGDQQKAAEWRRRMATAIQR